MISCKNCYQEFEGGFCPSCGQKHIEKFTWVHLSNLFLQSVEMEKGLLLNIKDLTIRPYQTIESYLNGKTKNYLNPIAYFLITLALITIIRSISDNLLYSGLEINSFLSSDEDIRVRNIFIMIFFAIGLTIGLKFFNRYSLLENVIISLFITSHVFLIYTLLSIVRHDIFIVLALAIPSLYAGYVIYKIIGRKILGSIWRLFTILIITMIFTIGGLFLKIPYFEQVNISDLKLEYDQQLSSISQLQDGIMKLHSLSSNSEVKEFELSTRKLLEQINNSKDGMIVKTGGYNEMGNFVGARDKSITHSFFQTIEDSLLIVQQEWLDELRVCGCDLVEKDGLITTENFQNKMMIEILLEFNKVEQNILLTQQQCYIKHLGKTGSN